MDKQEAFERLVAIARNINGERGTMEQLVRELASDQLEKNADEARIRDYREGRA